jgi:hypothetical protein
MKKPGNQLAAAPGRSTEEICECIDVTIDKRSDRRKNGHTSPSRKTSRNMKIT